MLEIMFDLETLDTEPSSIVLSVGAVVWRTEKNTEIHGHPLSWQVENRFYRILEFDSQVGKGRTLSQQTLLWWMQQHPNAREEAFSTVRKPTVSALLDFMEWGLNWTELGNNGETVNAFWASPVTFDMPIWESLARDYALNVPWHYRQTFDVRTVVKEASYSAKDHVPRQEIIGVPHMPVYDCEWQIDLLTAAREKIARRVG